MYFEVQGILWHRNYINMCHIQINLNLSQLSKSMENQHAKKYDWYIEDYLPPQPLPLIMASEFMWLYRAC